MPSATVGDAVADLRCIQSTLSTLSFTAHYSVSDRPTIIRQLQDVIHSSTTKYVVPKLQKFVLGT